MNVVAVSLSAIVEVPASAAEYIFVFLVGGILFFITSVYFDFRNTFCISSHYETLKS